MPENVFDKASRFAARRLDPEGFVSWLLNLPPGGFAFRGWLDTRAVPLPGDRDRTGDCVARIERPTGDQPPWALAVEFQTAPDPEMFGRLVDYLSVLWRHLRPDAERGSRFQVGAAVVNLTGNGLASRRMEWPEAGLATELKVVERNLEAESADELLKGIESGRWSRCLLPWVPLMAGAGEPGLADRWKSIATGEPDSRRRAEFGGIALLFAEYVGRKEVWHAKLEGWNVEESTVVREWVAMGEARGEARGRVATARAILVRLGTKRFGSPSADIETAIRAIEDADRLERIAERVIDATDWADLVATP
jgi:hypothetical protein